MEKLENELNNNIYLNNNKYDELNNKIDEMLNNIYDKVIKSVLPDEIADTVINIKDVMSLNKLSGNIADKVSNFISGNKKYNNSQNLSIINDINFDEQIDNFIDKIKKDNNLQINDIKEIEKNKDNISNNLERNTNYEIEKYIKAFNDNTKYIEEWKKNYEKKDFSKMQKSFKKIKKSADNLLPIAERLKVLKQLENIHLLIKSKGGDFNLTNEEIELAEKII